jgi:TP901 family phage tail tape measure protein
MPTGAQTRATLASVGGGMSVSGGISVGTLVGHVVADISGLTRGISKSTKLLQGFSVRMDDFLKRNATSMRRLGFRAAAVGAAVVAGVGAMVKTYGEFERRMRRATAVSDVSEEQFLEMSRMAEEASVRLNIAATRAADAFYYLGSAGLTATEQMEAFPAVATMSKAAVIEMNFSAEMMVDTIKAYQKSFKETTNITDIFTEAVTSSNMTFSHLGETLALVAAIGRRTNNTIADLTAMIGLMANTGIKGSRAGTSLRRALLNLAAPSNEVRVELAKWGVEVYDAEKKMKPFTQIIGEFGDALKNATEEQKNLAFKTLFGVRAITGQLAIFDLGVEKVQAYVDQLNNAGGASERVAKKQMKAFMEQVGRVGQEIKRLARHIGMSLAPAISNLADDLKPVIDGMTEWVDANEELVTAITATAASMGAMALVGGTLTIGLAGLAIAAGGLGVTVVGLGTAIAAVTLGIGALVGVVVYVVARIMKMRKEVARLKTELDLKDEISELKAYITTLDAAVTGPGPLNVLVGRLTAITGGLEELHDNAMRVMTATRKELLQMYKEFDLAVPEGLLGIPKATSVLREYLLHQIEFSRDMLAEMVRAAKDEAGELRKGMTKTVKEETEKQMTIFRVASEERRRERTDEYNDWRIATSAWAGEWTEAQYEMIQDLKGALEEGESALSDFFHSGITGAETWGDALKALFRDVFSAFTRMISDMIAKQMMLYAIEPGIAALWGGISGAITGAFGAKPITAATPTQVQLATVPHQLGGVFDRPHLATIGEVPEAVVPLSGGRNIPVEMRGEPARFDMRIYNMGSEKLEISKATEYALSDRRIIDVTVQAMKTDVRFGRGIAQVAKRR